MQQRAPTAPDLPTKLVEDLKRRFEQLKADPERANAQQHWEEIAEVMDPNHRGFAGARPLGEKRMQKVYDATGIHAADLLTAGLHGTATNPATKWHRLATQFPDANKAKAVREHLDKRTEILFARRYSPGTRFTSAINEVFDSAGRYGTGIMYITQRRDGRNMYECRALSECVIADNDEGDTDTLMRCYPWTARQCVKEWGMANVSEKVKALIEANKPDEKVEIVHAVYPRKDRDPAKKNTTNMPFASVYFERATAHKLEESGYPEFPFAVFRWIKRPGETYGTGPGSTALPDVKMLQQMMLVMIKAAQKVTDPPMFLPDDGFVGQTIRTLPGALNFYRGQREVYQMPVSGNLPVTLEIMEELRNRIRQTFFTDILQFVSDKDMTATEVQMRTAERMRLLGPVLGRLEEFLGKVVDIEDAIAKRMGVLPPVPEELLDGSLIPEGLDVELIVEYVGPIFQAQRAADANGFAQMLQYAGPIIESDPMAFKRSYSTERIVGWLGRTFMVPAELETTDDEKKQLAQMEQAQAAAAVGQPMAEAAQSGAGAVKQLADAQAGGGIDLQQIVSELGKRLPPMEGGALQ